PHLRSRQGEAVSQRQVVDLREAAQARDLHGDPVQGLQLVAKSLDSYIIRLGIACSEGRPPVKQPGRREGSLATPVTDRAMVGRARSPALLERSCEGSG